MKFTKYFSKLWIFAVLILSVSIAMVGICHVRAEEYTQGNLTFTVKANEVIIKRCDRNTTGSLVIPSELGGYPVIEIGESAISGCRWITSVTIPVSIKKMGENAFGGCTQLSEVYYLGSLAEWCQIDCENLFANPMNEAEHLYVEGKEVKGEIILASNEITKIPCGSFANCSELTSVVLSTEVVSIGEGAFSRCSGLSTIVFPLGLSIIGDSAFFNCTKLKDIDIPSNVTSIGDRAFFGCASLTSVKLPLGLTSIGKGTFSDCSMLSAITIDRNNLYYHSAGNCIVEIKTKKLIAGCQNSVIPTDGSVDSIDESAFYGCIGLTSIEIPASVTSIGNNAFSGCSNLSSIEIPSSVTFIGENIFSSCKSLKNITMPLRGRSLNNLFAGSERVLERLIIVDDKEIQNNAISGCMGLTSVEIPLSVTSIGDSAFSGCFRLTSIKIPSSVTAIGNYVFSGCTGLTSMEIPASVVSIGNCIFDKCKNLEKIMLPLCGKNFCDNFSVLPSALREVVVLGENIPIRAFSECDGLRSVIISDSVAKIGDMAFYNCSGLTSIEIPSSVTSIGDTPFYGCSKIKEITHSCQWSSEDLFGEPPYGLKTNLIHQYEMDRLAFDSEGHYHQCSVCKDKIDKRAHLYDYAADTTCNGCGFIRKIDPNDLCLRCSGTGLIGDEVCEICHGTGERTYIPGDLDGKEGIGSEDAVYLLMHVFYPEDYPVVQLCDFNGDSTVDSAYAVYLLMYVFYPEDYPLHS